jgi:uncharacterized protein with HEPN domain
LTREFLDSVEDVLDAIRKAQAFCAGMTFETFAADDKTVWATIRAIEVVGEAAKNVPPRVRTKHPDIPWPDVIGMRSKLIHDYFGIDLHVVWATVQEDFPRLLPGFERLRDDHSP